MFSYKWWCKCPALVQVLCAAGTTAAAGTSVAVAAGASGKLLLSVQFGPAVAEDPTATESAVPNVVASSCE